MKLENSEQININNTGIWQASEIDSVLYSPG